MLFHSKEQATFLKAEGKSFKNDKWEEINFFRGHFLIGVDTLQVKINEDQCMELQEYDPKTDGELIVSIAPQKWANASISMVSFTA